MIDSQAANLIFAEEEEEHVDVSLGENDDMLLCPSEKANEEAMLNLYIWFFCTN